MNLWDILLLALVAAAVCLAIYTLHRANKQGRSCGCGCSNCQSASCCKKKP